MSPAAVRNAILSTAMLCGWQLSSATQIDLVGPSGSVAFGESVTVLANGNFVVTDPQYSTATASGVGAVYLYHADGSLVSKLTGSSTGDAIGSVVALPNGNFVVTSPWNNGGIAHAGAVTWVNGITGLSGVVSTANSLVGTHTDDGVGSAITLLADGSYVVASPSWNGASGAVTWADSNSAVHGAVSSANSLVGAAGDSIGACSVAALSNGNYVVDSCGWNQNTGAITLCPSPHGCTGSVDATNSLVGIRSGDKIGAGGVRSLHNGNFVVVSPNTHVSTATDVVTGAATWVDGTSGLTGMVSTANSLFGVIVSEVPIRLAPVVELANGNYLVNSYGWRAHSGDPEIGALTWGSGTSGVSGIISAANSLIGTTTYGYSNLVPLSDGNFVNANYSWGDGSSQYLGAITWGDGNSGSTVGLVSATNSVIGSTGGDALGSCGFFVLRNGNFAVDSCSWTNGVPSNHPGAVTLMHGPTGPSISVSAQNSLTGGVDSRSGDGPGIELSDGNYVVVSELWGNDTANVGAVTWVDGSSPTVDVVSNANSLTGSSSNDMVGADGVYEAAGSNFVVVSTRWRNIGASGAGAVTLVDAGRRADAVVSPANSLVGGQPGDNVGYDVRTQADGNYVVRSPAWHNAQGAVGAVTLASGNFRLVGTVQSWNSVIGGVANPEHEMTYDYDSSHHRLIVGRPSENIVSVFTRDQVFAENFER